MTHAGCTKTRRDDHQHDRPCRSGAGTVGILWFVCMRDGQLQAAPCKHVETGSIEDDDACCMHAHRLLHRPGAVQHALA
jgi:hypothetical protein